MTRRTPRDVAADWADAHKIPLDPAEAIDHGPWAEWDVHDGSVYLGEWLHDRCPRCGEDSDRPNPPLVPPPGGDWNRQHGCGAWWSPYWTQVTHPTIEALAAGLAELRGEEQAERNRIHSELRRKLAGFLADPDAERHATGNDVEPGIYHDGQWIAWDYDPVDETETISVTAGEL